MLKAQALKDERYLARAGADDRPREGAGSYGFTWVLIAVCMIGLGLLELSLLQAESPEYAETTYGITSGE